MGRSESADGVQAPFRTADNVRSVKSRPLEGGKTLEARIAQLELDLEDTRLVSPVNGVVLEKLKEVGEIAVPGGFAGSGDLIRLANTDEMRAEIDVNEADLSKISMGQPARVIPDAYSDRRYAAAVIKLYPQINRQKGTLRVEVRILEPDAFLRPDMSARIDFLWEVATPEAGEISVLVPSKALRGGDEGRFVWIVSEGHVRRRQVEIGSSPTSDPDVVSRGLDGGEALVTSDASGLEEGTRVEVAPLPEHNRSQRIRRAGIRAALGRTYA